MLLRRVTQHIKDQNWFAVFIDFIIVVIGVFIGIQVANWNTYLNDQERADNYFERLTQEMSINSKTLMKRQDSYAQQVKYGLFALNASTPPIDDKAAWKIIHAFYQASHVFTMNPQRGTYDEIINSGDLALLQDQELINALSEFYTFTGFSTIQVIPVYRENIRRLVPYELQLYLQNKCYQVIIPDIHLLLDCPAPERASNLIKLAIELQSDEALEKDLRYMLSYTNVASHMASNFHIKAEAVLDKLAKSNP